MFVVILSIFSVPFAHPCGSDIQEYLDLYKKYREENKVVHSSGDQKSKASALTNFFILLAALNMLKNQESSDSGCLQGVEIIEE